ncbi:hypothetical protein [Geodermatophilus poikilotrophus]|uniref:DNA-binding beta-propeller fold protein YncE n=1 Tax=Geodermatophilus poikilotrophus TaxID=1333667 RepID=A0A1I0CPA3_9ACTN|nr:hypothetical protein [Geodermatophilus poikilotrophus]SET21429.1 hypothetical protein SAMN04488546_1692 [Geodermatophilus poikilotrophus]
MPRVRRTAAALAVVLTAAACTGEGDAGPSPRTGGDGAPALLGTVDLDAAVGGDARLLDLAAVPGDGPVALLGDGGTRAWLVEVAPGEEGPTATALLELPDVGDDAALSVLPDGSFLVAHTNPTAGYQLLTVPRDGQATVTALGLRPDRAATALSPDGRTLYAALSLPAPAPAQLLAVDVAAGVVTMTAPVVPGGTVPALATRPDGGVAALVETEDGRAVLTAYDGDLRPVGEPVDLAPDAPVGTPAGLDVTADGTVVATLHVSDGRELGRLVTVADGAVTDSIELDGVGDSALEVVVSPDGGSAWVPQADLSYPAELVTVDLASGERVSAVSLCAGAAVLGDVAPFGADAGLVATGSCVDGDGPQATAFLVG